MSWLTGIIIPLAVTHGNLLSILLNSLDSSSATVSGNLYPILMFFCCADLLTANRNGDSRDCGTGEVPVLKNYNFCRDP